LDFLTNQNEDLDTDDVSGSYIPESYILEPRLRIDAYRIIAALSTVELVDSYVEELMDRFGRPPDEVKAFLQEAKIRCLTEEANFDLIETRGNEIMLRHTRRGKDGERTYHRVAGRLPRLKAKKSLLKLNEIMQFLKMHIHGNNE
jgi:transcription-repair coupling factor (superfamily II helicase)